MATTLTAVALSGDRLTVAHVGDSRAYLLREGELRQLTTDQTVVQSLVDGGVSPSTRPGPIRCDRCCSVHCAAPTATSSTS